MTGPTNKTARVAAYIDGIDHARRQGYSWNEIAGQFVDVLGEVSGERLRILCVNARKAVAAGQYNPDQLPVPGDEPKQQPVGGNGGKIVNPHAPAAAQGAAPGIRGRSMIDHEAREQERRGNLPPGVPLIGD